MTREASSQEIYPSVPALPPCAAKADDLDAIRKSVEDAAAVSGALWLSYLFVLFYLAIAVGAVTHADLFLESAIKLPFLSGIDLPIKAFFFLAPLILCVTHVYTLTSFVLLSEKAQAYHRELKRQITGDEDPVSDASLRAEAVRDALRRQLPSNIFVQFLAGPDDVRSGPLGLVLKTIAWTTLVIAPVLLLLLMQLQFLPYHSRIVTWTTRLALLFDIFAVWWLWQAILLGRGESRRPKGWWSLVSMTCLACVSTAALAFSWTIATFPGESIDNKLFSRPVFPGSDPDKPVSMHDYLFSGPIDSITRRRGFFFSSTLILPVFDIFEHVSADDAKKLGPFKYVFHARGRDFRGAVFDLSNLSNVDFEGSLLEGASFDRAKLQNTSLFCARMHDAVLSNADLQGAWFYGTDLQKAHLDHAQGQGAMFDGAELKGAKLDAANFLAASFESADLTDASFDGAQLDAAAFKKRDRLSASCIDPARAAGGAQLDNTTLENASLVASTFAGARLTDVKQASVRLADTDFTDMASGRDAQAPSAQDRKALAQTLRGFVCSGDPNAIFVLRGLLSTERLADAGPEVLPLLDAIDSGPPECPLEALGVFDKMNVLKVRETIRSATDRKD